MEAVEKLAKRANVKLPEKELTAAQREKLEQRKRYLQINNYVARYYHKVLLETSAGQPYRDYLKKEKSAKRRLKNFNWGRLHLVGIVCIRL